MNEKCYVTVQIGETIVKGPIDKDKALALAIYITREIRTLDKPTQVNSGGSQDNHEQHSGKDDISPKQLMNLQKNPKWEQREICERYQVNSLEELTKQQASEAITTNMERKKKEKEQMN